MKLPSHAEGTVAKLITGYGGCILLILGYAALSNGWFHHLLLGQLGIDPAAPPTPNWRENLQLFGQDLLFRGMLLVGATLWMVSPKPPTIFATLERRRLLLPLVSIVLVVCWLPVVVVGYSAVIGGVRYWWLFDDAMISMRYAANFAHGHGLVWNPGGERIEGYTNFLWVIYMAIVHLLPLPLPTLALVVTLTNIVLAVATLPFLAYVVRMLGGQREAVVATLVAYGLSLPSMGWATAGAETVLLSFLLILSISLLLRDSERQQWTPYPFLVAGGMALVRSDALILAVLLYGVAFVLSNDKKRVIGYSAGSFLLPVAHIGFRLLYYGDIIPNTAHLKVTNWDNKIPHGIAYVADFAGEYILLLLFVLVGVVLHRSWQRVLLTGVVLVYGGYVAYAGGDGFPQFRFFVPILPVIFLLAFTAIERLIRWQSSRLMVTIVCLITMPLMTPGHTRPLYPHEVAVGNIEIGLVLKANVPPTTQVADFWAGLVFYYSDMQGIDLLGKNDAYIAKLPALYGDIPGHNKFDFAYSLGTLKPDVVNASFALPVDEAELAEWRESEAPWRSELYYDATFREHCLPYPVHVETWRTLFVCDWSDLHDQRDGWVVPF